MKICAVICEYDPFHSGHEYLIKRIKELGYAVVCIMSGSFTQRGTPAVITKYDRAMCAVSCGADLVIELPFPYCSLNAADFADAGVCIAEKLGCVSTLAFGSETGDTETLCKIAENVISEEFTSKVNEGVKSERYGARFTSAYKALFGEAVKIGSNDLLAVEYIKALKKRNSSITPIAFKREGYDFNSVSGEGFGSAAYVRAGIFGKGIDAVKSAVPGVSFDVIKKNEANGRIARAENLFLPYAAKFRTSEPDQFRNVAEINEELAARIINSASLSTNYAELVENAKTKLYSDSRVRRAMLMAMLGVHNDDVSEPSYSIILGANSTGRAILSDISGKIDFPLITKPADHTEYGETVKKDFTLLLRAESLWTLLLDSPRESALNVRSSPFISEV